MNHSPSAFIILAFALLFTPLNATPLYDTEESWRYGIPVAIGISLIGFLIAAIVIVFRKCFQKKFDIIIPVLISFACGTLLGDVFIHIIPHSIEGVQSGTDREKDTTNFMIFIGFFTFFLIEKFFLFFGVTHSHNEAHTHSLKNNDEKNEKDQENSNKDEIPIMVKKSMVEEEKTLKENQIKILDGELPQNTEKNEDKTERNGINQENIKIEENNNGTKTDTSEDKNSWKGKHSEGWLNLISDFLHNILDGLAIGVAFSTSDENTLIATVIAIVAHEIPGEIADVGVLLNSNFTNLQILICNTAVNFTALLGAIIGLSLGKVFLCLKMIYYFFLN